LEFLANLLHHSYGVTRENADNGFPRPFRIVPSAGALYPLEIFFHSSKVQGLQDGIYHYHPARNCLRQLSPRNESKNIAERLIQPEIALEASVIIFITAIFERSVFKYGDRGYRFVLLEAGHVAQNMNLVGNALGLGCVNLGGFFDREIDDFLGLDGVTHSTLYLIAIGKRR
jgi:SagB-type dehydrogenase family enzyme